MPEPVSSVLCLGLEPRHSPDDLLQGSILETALLVIVLFSSFGFPWLLPHLISSLLGLLSFWV